MDIKKLRKRLNLTQVQFGEVINKSHATIRKYESGELEIPHNIVELLVLKYPQHFEDKNGNWEIANIKGSLINQENSSQLKLENERLKKDIKFLEDHVNMIKRNNELLEENNRLLKQRLSLYEKDEAKQA